MFKTADPRFLDKNSRISTPAKHIDTVISQNIHEVSTDNSAEQVVSRDATFRIAGSNPIWTKIPISSIFAHPLSRATWSPTPSPTPLHHSIKYQNKQTDRQTHQRPLTMLNITTQPEIRPFSTANTHSLLRNQPSSTHTITQSTNTTQMIPSHKIHPPDPTHSLSPQPYPIVSASHTIPQHSKPVKQRPIHHSLTHTPEIKKEEKKHGTQPEHSHHPNHPPHSLA